MFKLSYSGIMAYLECPYKYRQLYIEEDPKPQRLTDLPRLMGSVAHSCIETMENGRPIDGSRRFFFWTPQKAIGYALAMLDKEIEESKDILVPYSGEQLKKSKDGLSACIAFYWKVYKNQNYPLHSEWTLSHLWDLGREIMLTGVIDQVMPATLVGIQALRPDLVVNGQLNEVYDPIWIVDFKSGWASFSPYEKDGRVATEEEWLRIQASLHQGLQFTMYAWLYFKQTGKLPIGFKLFHLRSGKLYTTFRTKDDFKLLDEVVTHVFRNLDNTSYPKVPKEHCARCDFYMQCLGERARISRPSMSEVSEPLKPTTNVVVAKLPHQSRFELGELRKGRTQNPRK